jgi:hypothetical protein
MDEAFLVEQRHCLADWRAPQPEPVREPPLVEPDLLRVVRQKTGSCVSILTRRSVCHRLLRINAHRLGIYGPPLNENTITCLGQQTRRSARDLMKLDKKEKV